MINVFRTCLMITSLMLVSLTATAGNAEAGKAKTMVCAGCHGADGNSMISANPNLAGQNEKYIAKQLADFKSNDRPSPIMAGMVMALSPEDMANIGAFYEAQNAPAVPAPKMSEEDLKIGETIYRAGNAENGVAACISCHGPNGNGNAPAGWPKVSGQHAEYTVAQLKAYRLAAEYPEKNNGRRNDGDGKIMQTVSKNLSDREIKAVSAYLQGLH